MPSTVLPPAAESGEPKLEMVFAGYLSKAKTNGSLIFAGAAGLSAGATYYKLTSNHENLQVVGHLQPEGWETSDSNFDANPIDFAFYDHYVIVAYNGIGVNIYDLDDESKPVYVSSVLENSTVTSVLVVNAKLFALKSGQLYSYDITDPTSPIALDSIAVTGTKIEKYQDYVLIPNGTSGVSVINAADASDLSLTATLPLAGTYIWDIVVNQDKLYLADTAGLKIYDITTIATPALLGSFAVNVRTMTYDNNLIYTTGSQVRILDVSNPASISELSAVSTAGMTGQSLIKIDSTIISTHGYNGFGISQIASSTLTFTKLINSYCGTSGFAAHNSTTVYLNDDCGLNAWDFSDLSSPISITTTSSDVDNDWERQEGYVVNNVLYTNGAGGGLFSYDISDPTQITKNWNYSTYSCMNGFQILGNYIYCGGWNQGFYILDISNPTVMPSLVGRFYENNTTYFDAIKKVGTKVILSRRNLGSAIYDVSDPTTPTFVKQLSVSGCFIVEADSQYAYVETGNTLSIVDMLDADPTVIGSINLGNMLSFLLNGNYLYVGGRSKIYVVDIQDKTNPILLQTYDYPVGYAMGLHIYNHRLFVGSDSGGYAVFSGILGI